MHIYKTSIPIAKKYPKWENPLKLVGEAGKNMWARQKHVGQGEACGLGNLLYAAVHKRPSSNKMEGKSRHNSL